MDCGEKNKLGYLRDSVSEVKICGCFWRKTTNVLCLHAAQRNLGSFQFVGWVSMAWGYRCHFVHFLSTYGTGLRSHVFFSFILLYIILGCITDKVKLNFSLILYTYNKTYPMLLRTRTQVWSLFSFSIFWMNLGKIIHFLGLACIPLTLSILTPT